MCEKICKLLTQTNNKIQIFMKETNIVAFFL